MTPLLKMFGSGKIKAFRSKREAVFMIFIDIVYFWMVIHRSTRPVRQGLTSQAHSQSSVQIPTTIFVKNWVEIFFFFFSVFNCLSAPMHGAITQHVTPSHSSMAQAYVIGSLRDIKIIHKLAHKSLWLMPWFQFKTISLCCMSDHVDIACGTNRMPCILFRSLFLRYRYICDLDLLVAVYLGLIVLV